MAFYRHIKFALSVIRHLAKASSEQRKNPQVLLDLRDAVSNPLEAWYRSRGLTFFMLVPWHKCYFIGYPAATADNPFVVTLKAYGKGLCRSYEDSPLRHFYETWQPDDPLIDTGSRSYPWMDSYLDRENKVSGRLGTWEFRKVAYRLGYNKSDISGHFGKGPVSMAFGHITFTRFTQVYDSIKGKGFRPLRAGISNIMGSFLIRDNDYRVVIGSGKHRIAALLALDYDMIPVQFGPPRFPALVRSDDADSWPNVRDGHYTVPEARLVFNNVFRDTHPSNWKWPVDQSD